MTIRLRWKFAFIGAVALTCISLFIGLGINLGLDLRGGEHLILRVLTDDVIRTETDRTIQGFGPEIQAVRASNNEIGITGGDAYSIAESLTGWEAVSHSQLRLKAQSEASLRDDSVSQSIRTIQNRLDRLGVGEVTLQRYGRPSDYEILAELPGVDNPDRVRQIIKSTAMLKFQIVEGGPFKSREAASQSVGGVFPGNLELLADPAGQYYILQRSAAVSGSDLNDAYLAHDENGRPAVGFAFTAAGARRFGDLTGENIGRDLSVVLDDRIQSVARIDMKISDSGVIRGGGKGFAPKEAADLILILKSGALPASIEYAEEQIVGPSLGADSIHDGVRACAVAVAAVVTFMLLYYRGAGLNAVVAMTLNIVILLGLMAYFRATLTLPGIAGIVLTIGVGIDSNVLVFERIREEIRQGKPAASAVGVAFRKVFLTLVDTHVAALISAAFLFVFGTGAIKGFAVTLVIGLVSNMFTSLFVSHAMFDWVLFRGGRGGNVSI